jgi:hypothetical protein
VLQVITPERILMCVGAVFPAVTEKQISLSVTGWACVGQVEYCGALQMPPETVRPHLLDVMKSLPAFVRYQSIVSASWR